MRKQKNLALYRDEAQESRSVVPPSLTPPFSSARSTRRHHVGPAVPGGSRPRLLWLPYLLFPFPVGKGLGVRAGSGGGSERIITRRFVPALHQIADSLNGPARMTACSVIASSLG